MARYRNNSTYVFQIGIIGGSWLLASLVLGTSLSANMSWTQKSIFFIIPAILSVVLLLTDLQKALPAMVALISFLVSQTGFQVQFRGITTSALEVSILGLVGLIWINQKKIGLRKNISNVFPSIKYLLWMIFISTINLVFSVILTETSLNNALYQYKGFLIYPLIGLIFVTTQLSRKMIKIIVGAMGAWYAYLSMAAIYWFQQANEAFLDIGMFDQLQRASGGYAPINVFGITVASMAVLLLGFALDKENSLGTRLLFLILALVNILGTVTSVARTASLMFVIGVLVILAFRARRSFILVFILVILIVFSGGLFFYSLQGTILDRLFQLSDSSTLKRLFYLESGLRTFREYWLTGTGWGNGMFYYPSIGLVPTHSIPWYHNDYLNLAVQTGVIGIGLFAAFLFATMRGMYKAIRADNVIWGSDPLLIAGFTSLLVLLVSGMFEHTLWRPDSAGFVGWVLGISLLVMKTHIKAEGGDSIEN